MTVNESKEQHQFFIQRLYTKNISFESPNVPAIFQEEWEPELNLDINIKNNRGETCFHLIISNKCYDMLSYILTIDNLDYNVGYYEAGFGM